MVADLSHAVSQSQVRPTTLHTNSMIFLKLLFAENVCVNDSDFDCSGDFWDCGGGGGQADQRGGF